MRCGRCLHSDEVMMLLMLLLWWLRWRSPPRLARCEVRGHVEPSLAGRKAFQPLSMLPPFWTPPTRYKLFVYFLDTDNAISLFTNYTDKLYFVLSFSTMISFFHTSLLATLCVLECVSISVTRIERICKLY